MLTKRGITLCLLSVVLFIYLLIALSASHSMAAEAPCNGVRINVSQNEMSQFVTAADIDHELNGIQTKAQTLPASEIDLRDIEQHLGRLSFVENVNCLRLANDMISIDVVPLIPVARVFDNSGSYYINRAGKHLQASPRYQIDVPVLIVEDSIPDLPGVIGLLDQINGNDKWSQLVSALKIDREGDIFIIPSIRGHIVNIGDAGNFDNKMSRLFAFYKEVLDVKGWNYYDTVTVKFANQVIGRIVPGKMRQRVINEDDLQYEEGDIDIDIINQRDSVQVKDIKPKIL